MNVASRPKPIKMEIQRIRWGWLAIFEGLLYMKPFHVTSRIISKRGLFPQTTINHDSTPNFFFLMALTLTNQCLPLAFNSIGHYFPTKRANEQLPLFIFTYKKKILCHPKPSIFFLLKLVFIASMNSKTLLLIQSILFIINFIKFNK